MVSRCCISSAAALVKVIASTEDGAAPPARMCWIRRTMTLVFPEPAAACRGDN